MRRVPFSVRQAFAASLVVHLFGGWLVALWYAATPVAVEVPEFIEIDVSYPPASTGVGAALQRAEQAWDHAAQHVPQTARARGAQLDTDETGAGLPGDGPGINAASRLADVDVSRETRNHQARQQWQRLRHSTTRRSNALHRTTPNPQQLTIVTTGRGSERVRRASAARTRPEAALSVAPGSLPQPSAANGGRPGSGALPAAVPQTRTSRSARMDTQRADVERRDVSVPAQVRGRVTDRLDTDLAVASRVASLISASGPRGQGGDGFAGKSGFADRIGSAGPASGERAVNSGSGGGEDAGPDPATIAYYAYVRSTLGRLIQSAFPAEAKAAGRGGMATFSFVIQASGSIVAVKLERASGVPDYDTALQLGIGRTQLRPPPSHLVPVAMRMRFVGINPAVSNRLKDPTRH